MSLDPKLPIKLDLTLNEVEGVLAGLGELPTKSGAFGLLMKIQSQVQMQVPLPEEPAVSDINPEDIKPA
jgi:hypothetical protein